MILPLWSHATDASPVKVESIEASHAAMTAAAGHSAASLEAGYEVCSAEGLLGSASLNGMWESRMLKDQKGRLCKS